MGRWVQLVSAISVAALAACQQSPGGAPPGGDDPVASAKRIVFPRPGGADSPLPEGAWREKRPVPPSEAGWEDKLHLARSYEAGGYDVAALEVLDAALGLDPPNPWLKRLREARQGIAMRRLEEGTLRISAEPLRDYLPFGAPADLRLDLRNVSGKEIVLRHPGGQGLSPPTASLTIHSTSFDVNGTRLRRTWRQNLPLVGPDGAELKIPPGQTHHLALQVPASEIGGVIRGLIVLEVGGMLHATPIEHGEQSRLIRLRIRPARVVVLPRNYEPLLAAPLDSMRRALALGAPDHLLVAAEFVPRGRLSQAMALLARAIEEGSAEVSRAAVGALLLMRGRLAGRPLKPLLKPFIEALDRNPRRLPDLADGMTALSDDRLPLDARLWTSWWENELSDSDLVPPPTPDEETR